MPKMTKFTVGALLTVCALFFTLQSHAAVEVSDAELDSVIVGGPITCDADCACPQCYNTSCGPYNDPIGGTMCQHTDGWLFHEDCNCNGYGWDGDFCHLLTLINCYKWQTFYKNPQLDCYQGAMLCYQHGAAVGSRITQKYDECTETSSNPHL